jgi:hypothetical protein
VRKNVHMSSDAVPIDLGRKVLLLAKLLYLRHMSKVCESLAKLPVWAATCCSKGYHPRLGTTR